MKKALIIVGLFILLAVGFLLTKQGKSKTDTLDTPLATGEVIIHMTDAGYEPNKITIQKGTMVTFVNDGQNEHWPASNIHPTHGIYPKFDPQKNIAPGESWSFTFDKAGIWHMHDHTYPQITGTITVQ